MNFTCISSANTSELHWLQMRVLLWQMWDRCSWMSLLRRMWLHLLGQGMGTYWHSSRCLCTKNNTSRYNNLNQILFILNHHWCIQNYNRKFIKLCKKRTGHESQWVYLKIISYFAAYHNIQCIFFNHLMEWNYLNSNYYSKGKKKQRVNKKFKVYSFEDIRREERPRTFSHSDF